MKYLITMLSVGLVFTGVRADDEVIEKVMKEGMKGNTSPMAKTLEGKATDDEIKKLNELVGTLKGTKAPKGDQEAYTKKVTALIEAMGKVAGGDKGAEAIGALKTAQNCKACHKEHKPD